VDARGMSVLEELERDGRLPIRVYAMLSLRDEDLIREWIERGPDTDNDSMLVTRAVKAYYDGALGSRGARLLYDYSDRPGHRGISGDGYGFDQALNAAAMKAGFHPRLGKLGVLASMEPPHAMAAKAWAEERLGPERILGAYAWRSLREAGADITFNADNPGSDHSIFYGLHSAITRQDKNGQPEGGWYAEQRLGPEESVRAYTTWSAYASFRENDTGLIAAGRWADLTVMDIDPFVLGDESPFDLLNGRILMTIVNGNVVYVR